MTTATKAEVPEQAARSIASLEERVMQAVSLIAGLRDERDALRAELSGAHRRIAELERSLAGVDIEAMRRDADALRRQNDALTAERGEVLRRIDSLVDRLGELATSS